MGGLKDATKIRARANEISSSNPLVSYYTHLWSIQLAIKSIQNPASPEEKTEASQFVNDAMADLEQLGEEGLPSSENASKMITVFGLKIFSRAHSVDSAGRSSGATAKTYLAAEAFLSVLEQFGTLDSSITDKMKFAKVRALTILKFIKAGKRPPLPKILAKSAIQPAGQPDAPLSETIDDDDDDLESLSSQLHNMVNNNSIESPSAPTAPLHQHNSSPPPSYNNLPGSSAPNYTSTTSTDSPGLTPEQRKLLELSYKPPPGHPMYIDPSSEENFFAHGPEDEIGWNIDHKKLSEAQQLLKSAVSAVQFEDIRTAISKAKEAIIVLNQLK